MSGCAAKETPGPGTTNKLLDELPRVGAHPRDTCETQRLVAAQNSYVDTIREGTELIYKAPCDIDPKPAVKPAAKPAGVAAEIEAHKPAPRVPAVDAERARRTG